jgi:hypothetical protein
MDIPNATNKAMDPSDSDNKMVQPTTAKAVSSLENEYFYPEANGYQAICVRAATKYDADAIYLARRKPVSPEKVDEPMNNA